MRFIDLVPVDRRPSTPVAAVRTPVETDTYARTLSDDPRNNGFVSGLIDRRRGSRMKATRRGFLRGTVTAAAATTAVTAANLFGPARRIEAQSSVVGSYPRRMLQFCPPYNSGDNCQPGCGSSPICTDCCGSDGFFRNDPANGYTLYAGGCGDGDIADGWIWRYSGKCGSCAEIEYRCSDGYVQTDTGPAPFICRAVTDCVPLADGEEAGPDLVDASRDTNWRPAGALEVAIDQGGSVSLSGWIADGSGVPVQMRVRAGNQIVFVGASALPRPDVAARVQGAGPNTGFSVSFPFENGQYQFCVDALSGVLTSTIGCIDMNVGAGGSVRGSGQTGSITAPPPAPSPDAPASGSTAPVTPAPTVGAIVLPEINGSSDSPTLGAVQVLRRSGERTGFVSGWAGDPDTDDAVYIDVQVDGESVATTRTDLPRSDVAAAFAALNPTTGFALTFPLPPEPVEVCIVAVSPDDGRRQPLGCQQLADVLPEADRVDNGPSASGTASQGTAVVYGGIDEVQITASGFAVRGWAFDPNDRERTVVIAATTAAATQDVETGLPHAEALRTYGVAGCGFQAELALPAGFHDLTVQVAASDGSTGVLGAETVFIP